MNHFKSYLERVEHTQVSCSPHFEYPWVGLEDYLSSSCEGALPLIGYGSLLNTESAARTLSDFETSRLPCVGFGCKRVFNYDMPPPVLERYSISSCNPERAALNAVVTRELADIFNGALINVRSSDLDALRVREFGYDLTSIPYFPWEGRNDASVRYAYVLTAPDLAVDPQYQVVNASIFPQKEYAEICRSGAAEYSPEFLNAYLDSTYLADKTTLWKSYSRPS